MNLPDEVLKFLRDFVGMSKKIDGIKQIRLYGSYAQNRWSEESDVDIAIFVEDSKSDHIKDIYKKLYIMCYDYSLDVQIQVFSESELLKPMGIIEEVVSYGIDVTTLV